MTERRLKPAPRQRRRLSPAVGFVLGAAVAGAPAHAQALWRFIDRDLATHRGELVELREDGVVYVDSTGRTRERAAPWLLALAHDLPPETRPPRELPWITRQLERFTPRVETEASEGEPFVASLVLDDGQVWRGSLLSAQGQSVLWLLEESAPLRAPLERIREAAILASLENAHAGWAGIDDRLLLVNGDVLDGFLADLGPPVRLETDGGATEIPPERVAGFLVANPRAEARGVRIRTRQGSVVAAPRATVSVGGELRADLRDADQTGAMLRLPVAEVRSVLLDPEAIGALGRLQPAHVGPPPGEQPDSGLASAGGWQSRPDAQLGLDHIELRAPIALRWALPRPAARLAARVRLPPAMWAWGDCEVVVLDAEGRETFRARLNAEEPEAEFNVPLGGGDSVTIALLPGQSGPVQDRVIIEQPVLSWKRPTGR